MSTTRSSVAVYTASLVGAVSHPSTRVGAVRASVAPSATTSAPVRALMFFCAATTTKTARQRSVFAAVRTAEFAHGALRATVPELDSLESCATKTLTSAWQMAVRMAGGVSTRWGRTAVTVNGPASPGHAVT